MQTSELDTEWLNMSKGLTPCDPLKIKKAIHEVLKTTVTKPEAWKDDLTVLIQVIHPILNEMDITPPLQFYYDNRLINIIRFFKDHESELIEKGFFLKYGSVFYEAGFRDEIIEALATLPFSKRVKVQDGDIDLILNQFDEKEVFSKAMEIQQQNYN